MANPIIHIVTSREDDFLYYDNLGFLRNELKAAKLHFDGKDDVYRAPQFTFNAGRVYDFTRSAKAAVRNDLTDHLLEVLNPAEAVKQQVRDSLLSVFDRLFAYYAYKGSLDDIGQTQHESLNMLIFFNHESTHTQFVAHVTLNSTTRKTAANQYTVDVDLVCKRFTYFPLQETDFQQVLQALQDLHVE